jgi:hypothetical protein
LKRWKLQDLADNSYQARGTGMLRLQEEPYAADVSLGDSGQNALGPQRDLGIVADRSLSNRTDGLRSCGHQAACGRVTDCK